MMDATVLSVPRTGTRFTLYFLMMVLGLKVRYDHFGVGQSRDRITHLLDNVSDDHPIIVVQGNRDYVEDTFPTCMVDALYEEMDSFMPRLRERSGTAFINVEERTGLGDILRVLNIGRTSEIDALEASWPYVGYSKESPENTLVLDAMDASNRMRTSYIIGEN